MDNYYEEVCHAESFNKRSKLSKGHTVLGTAFGKEMLPVRTPGNGFQPQKIIL
jgi:hypothetical protein